MSHDHHQHDQEFEPVEEFSRRSFLKLAGFSFAGTVIAGCEQSNLEKAIPYLVRPEEITPGVPYWYASTCGGCSAGCGVLVKNRDGRPIKVEGNPSHPVSRGGLCAIGQATIVSLYDSQRLNGPLMRGRASSWDAVDAEVLDRLETIRKSGGSVRFLTGSVTSPTTRALINRFLAQFKDARHVEYDPVSSSAILDAHKLTHGERLLPRFLFERAETVVSFDADFLGTWLSPVEFTKGYRAGRSLAGRGQGFSHHVQIESRLSLTGSNADERVIVSPHELALVLPRLGVLLSLRAGGTSFSPADPLPGQLENRVAGIAERLWKCRGKSLVLCGTNDLRLQVQVNLLNQLLGNYDATIDLQKPSYQCRGNDGELSRLVDQIRSGSVQALFVEGVNPLYDLPDAGALRDAFPEIPLLVSLAERVDETAETAHVVLPQPHALERWHDAEATAGVVSLSQPTVQPLRSARTLAESLSVWLGEKKGAYDLIREEWERSVFRRQKREPSFTAFWNKTLHDGFAAVETRQVTIKSFNFSVISTHASDPPYPETQEAFALVLHPSSTMLDGRHAHNPWLQELADPVTKIVWDNYASLSVTAAAGLDVNEGDVISIQTEQNEVLELPVHIQPGQDDRVVSVGLGYGRRGTDRFTDIGPNWLQSKPTVSPGGLVGVNAAPLLRWQNGMLTYAGRTIVVAKTGRKHPLAATQEYHSLTSPDLLGRGTGEKRAIIQQTSFAAYSEDPTSGGFQKHKLDSLWPDDHQYPGHRWGMVVDLTACTGCSACVVGCQAENNIPVVGKDEVGRNRELQWLRIDRYYDDMNGELFVSHQPMMCQHCGNAPCETVCPVLATVHDSEGLNQQIYNRCVGTRYCANNCPYKVRHFNWFEYPRGDELQRMVLNPDVTVRERGVMEKCSFCVQRMQLAKIEAKNEGRPLRDGDVQPACQQSCPADAITFGDMNNPESRVSRKMSDPRHYRVLEELGVLPSVGYMTLVRDTDGSESTGSFGAKGAAIHG
jgi:molybdopterin-containing oxidoreductase family iron-sulfur binding subunit